MDNLKHLHSTDEIRTAFRSFCSDRGIRYTSARQAVLDAVLALHEHFEVEQILYLLRERGSRVGKATVYRTLPLLVDCGILKQVRFDVKHVHYEHDFGQGPHDHMVCENCGRIVEFSSEEVIKLRLKIGHQHEFHVSGHRLQLTGLCSECHKS